MILALNRLFMALFYGAVLLILVRSDIPPVPDPSTRQLGRLLNGEDSAFPRVGSEYAALAKALPPHEPISFIMDFPYHPYGRTIEQLYRAHSFFAPRIVNPAPTEKIAVIYCSNPATATRRMRETGYQIVKDFGGGKALGIKA